MSGLGGPFGQQLDRGQRAVRGRPGAPAMPEGVRSMGPGEPSHQVSGMVASRSAHGGAGRPPSDAVPRLGMGPGPPHGLGGPDPLPQLRHPVDERQPVRSTTPGQLGHPGPEADLAVGVVGRCPRLIWHPGQRGLDAGRVAGQGGADRRAGTTGAAARARPVVPRVSTSTRTVMASPCRGWADDSDAVDARTRWPPVAWKSCRPAEGSTVRSASARTTRAPLRLWGSPRPASPGLLRRARPHAH